MTSGVDDHLGLVCVCVCMDEVRSESLEGCTATTKLKLKEVVAVVVVVAAQLSSLLLLHPAETRRSRARTHAPI